MSAFEECQKMITELAEKGPVFTKGIDLMVQRPDHMIVRYYSNGYRMIDVLYKDDHYQGHNYKDGMFDTRDMAPFKSGPQ